MPGLPGYEDLMLAIEGCEEQWEADMPDLPHCNGELHWTHQKGEPYEGHLPLRHPSSPIEGAQHPFCEQHMSTQQSWAADLWYIWMPI